MKKSTLRIGYFCLCLLLSFLLTACSLWPGREEPNEPAEPTISPVIEVSENYYGSTIPYKTNQTRGMLSGRRDFRIDFSHLELGLMEIARETFSTEDYLFQEGQQISKEQVKAWLSSATPKNPEGLNPEKGEDLLIHVLEHDYLDKDSQKLAGIVLGLSLSPTYQEDKRYSTEELRLKGEKLAARIVQKVRAENQQIPMVVAIYQVPDSNSTLVPGNFILTGTVQATENAVSKWQPIDEKFYLFPSNQVYKDHPQISIQYEKLFKDVQSFFGEYIGLTGVGRFMNGELVELTITATAEYDSRTEVLQFTQYLASMVNKLFEKEVHINVYVQSIHQPLALYIRPQNEQPYLHVYRK